MHFLAKQTNVAAVVALLAGVASAAQPTKRAAKGEKVVPGGYIIELEKASNAKAPDFYANASSSGIDVTPRLSLSHSLFKGLSFVVAPEQDNETTFDTLQSFSSVKSIWPIRLYSRPVTNYTLVSASKTALSSALMKRDAENYAVHQMGGVDKLRAQGYDGEGMFVAIIDTGVDYNHPLLGGGFGPGFKIAHGTDLVGDDYDGTNTPIPDDDPMDCLGHGTHVSGIVGANYSPELGFSGVVPNATLGMWKVFGCYNNVGDDVLINAFNLAYESGADVITCSIGGNNGWSESAWDVAVTRIVEAGTPCTIAAGNDGVNALFDSSGAGDAVGAISVGSIDSITNPIFATGASYLVDGVVGGEFAYDPSASGGDFGAVKLPLYAITLDSTVTNDACSPLDPATPNLSKYVVLVRRGTCTFASKVANVAAFGAKNVLIYNNVDGLLSPLTTDPDVVTALVQASVGNTWVADLIAEKSVTVEFTALADAPSVVAVDKNALTGGTMSTFTSWGPTNEMLIKPEVSAPGGNILSTYPNGSFAVESGTSMATPFTAGVVALIKQVRGKGTSPGVISSLLATTAKPVNFNDGSGTQNFLTSVFQQGGGLINAYAAASYTSHLDIINIPLNDTANFDAAHSFTITNSGSKPVTYKLVNTPAGTIYTFGQDNIHVPIPSDFYDYEFNLTASAAIRFTPASSITVAAGASAAVVAHFTAPKGFDSVEYRIPLYSGFISINSSIGETLNLPYAGAVGVLKHVPLWNGNWGPFFYDEFYNSVPPNTTFTLAGPNSTYIPTNAPVIDIVLAMGTRIMRVDIVPLNPRGLPRVLGKQILGSAPGFPYYYAVRQQGFLEAWDGTLSTGEYAPEGTYKFLFRALSLLGDETYGPDYQSWESEYFNIKYA